MKVHASRLNEYFSRAARSAKYFHIISITNSKVEGRNMESMYVTICLLKSIEMVAQ
jgi:hypothetical protein